MTRQPVTVDFRFRRWALALFVAAGLFGFKRVTDWAVVHGTYFDYGD